MRKLLITQPAQSDIGKIKRYTHNHYGLIKAHAYETVLKQALRDIRDDPYRPGSKERPEIADNIRSYHTAMSRERAGSVIKSPRHFILYYLPHEDEIVISRILHDSSDLARHIPDQHIEDAKRLTRNRTNKNKERSRER